MIKTDWPGFEDKDLTKIKTLMDCYSVYIPLPGPIDDLRLYLIQGHELACIDYKKDCYCIGAQTNLDGQFTFYRIPLRNLPKPSERGGRSPLSEAEEFLGSPSYREAAAKRILEINQAIEEGRYTIKIRHKVVNYGFRFEISSFSIRNKEGLEEKLI